MSYVDAAIKRLSDDAARKALSDVLLEFGTAMCAGGNACTHFDCVAEQNMGAAILTLRAERATLTARAEAAERERDRIKSLIDATGAHWLALTNDVRIPWEGAIDEAMRAACEKILEQDTEIQRLRTLADDDEAVVRAANALAISTGKPLNEWRAGTQEVYRNDARAALRAALGGAP